MVFQVSAIFGGGFDRFVGIYMAYMECLGLVVFWAIHRLCPPRLRTPVFSRAERGSIQVQDFQRIRVPSRRRKAGPSFVSALFFGREARTAGLTEELFVAEGVYPGYQVNCNQTEQTIGKLGKLCPNDLLNVGCFWVA